MKIENGMEIVRWTHPRSPLSGVRCFNLVKC